MRDYFRKISYISVLYTLILFFLFSGTSYAFKVTRLKHLFYLENGLLQPSDVAVGKDHLIYVMDGVNNRVVVFDQG